MQDPASSEQDARPDLLHVFSNDFAFAALKDDGSIVTWGSPTLGGDSSSVAAQLTGGVVHVFSTDYAFAALKNDGSVVAWGDSSYGGNSATVASQLQSGVAKIFSNETAFAALSVTDSFIIRLEKADGTLVAETVLEYPSDYQIIAPVGQSYRVKAYLDTNRNDVFDEGELEGIHSDSIFFANDDLSEVDVHLNSPPSNLLLSPQSISENQSAETVVGQLEAVDRDDSNGSGQYFFAFAGGDGSEHNGLFSSSSFFCNS